MKKITTFIMVLSVLALPLTTASATTTTTTTTSTTPSSLEEVMNTDKVDHGQISLDIGVPRRINSSPSGLVDLDLGPAQVLNQQLLELYARKLVLTEPIKGLSIGEESIEMTISGTARLLGIIPVGLPHEVVVDLDTQVEDITVDNSSSWGWLAAKPNPAAIIANIQAEVDGVDYLSVTQMKAYLLEAIVGAVTS